MESTLQTLDLQFNWHPCSQMKDYESFKPLVIERAYDSYLELSSGEKVIDAISSWWCKSLGHNHPVLKKALLTQLDKFEHTIFANTTSEVIVRLSQALAQLMPGLDKIFYTGDGSCAVETALKMSLHARMIQGDKPRNQFIALKNGYHGETAAALSVSDVGLYRDPYEAILFSPVFVDVPYVSGSADPLWDDASDQWSRIEKQLAPYTDTTTAIIFEPILQGAGGMSVYSPDFLSRLVSWAKQHDIHVIADEIMTGIGRTGKMLACEHAKIQPDFICLSKGLTSGWMPLSAVLTSNEIYQLFYDDYEKGKSFLHSHTYSGNALAASVAVATLEIIKKENLCERANELQIIMRKFFEDIAERTGNLENIRGVGAMVAADLRLNSQQKRAGYRIYQEAVRRGALLRPLGDTIYWLPPLTISEQTLHDLNTITRQAISSVVGTQER